MVGWRDTWTHKAACHADRVASSTRVARLNLAGVDLAHNAPRCTKDHAEEEDAHNHHPPGSAMRLHGVGGVEATDEEHETSQDETPRDGRGPAPPFVHEEESWDGNG